nr:methyl-CpG-binding domain protein 2-like [Aegilops tauschii subsp. strangulata]
MAEQRRGTVAAAGDVKRRSGWRRGRRRGASASGGAGCGGRTLARVGRRRDACARPERVRGGGGCECAPERVRDKEEGKAGRCSSPRCRGAGGVARGGGRGGDDDGGWLRRSSAGRGSDGVRRGGAGDAVR